MAEDKSPPRRQAESGSTDKSLSDEEPTGESPWVPEAALAEETTDVVEAVSLEPPASELVRDLVLTVLSGPQTGLAYVLAPGETVVGRAQGCDLVLVDQGLSRHHCRLTRNGDAVWLEDLGSRNGTLLDGAPILGKTKLAEGARIGLGRHTLLGLSRQDRLEQRAARQLYDSSMQDPLTELHNRRVFDQRLREEHAFATRHQAPLSIVLLDLDHFKAVNDTWGHQAGDQVLRHVAGLVKRCVRQEDVAARFGGEEFAFLMRTESHAGARAVAERMRQRIETTPTYFGGQEIMVTVSAGVATAVPPRMIETPTALLAEADRALYRAKAAGRNRIEG